MKFCSECGAKMPFQLATDGPKRLICPACSTSHYRNPSITVGCFAHHDGRILMCRRAHEPARGLWSIPSGYLECGETLEQAAARETLEETGVILDPDKLDLYGVINMTDVEQVCVLFRISLATEPTLRAGPECFEVSLMSEAQIATHQLAWPASLTKETRDFFRQLRLGDFAIRLVRLASASGGAHSCRNYRIL